MIVSTINELREKLSYIRKQGKTIGLVPTMGFLHEGHLSLIKRAKQETDFVVVSDFVNPTQFAPNEDFDSYPRDIDRDYKLAMETGADIVFYPSVEEMYPKGSSTFVEVTGDITKVLCGQTRPTHFRGVTTVVNMLFNIVKPDKAFFGQKDTQQAAVLTKMINDTHQEIELIVCPIIREKDGLAKSSRNTYLNADEREQALILYESLKLAKEKFNGGEKNIDILKQLVVDNINTMPLAKIDYVEIYSYPMLTKIDSAQGKFIIAVAVYFGKTRLIDNVILE
ncbi:MAG: pantoate--beta-alanine ligase [Bacteroidales bacterium]|jgi:pantoate--beta-alanine ligase